MQAITSVVILVLLATSCSSMRSQQASVDCPKQPGFIAGPYVPDEMTARRIAEAIIGSIENRNKDEVYVLKVMDSGSHWDAFQSLPNAFKKTGSDTFTFTTGGGGVEMRIEKCDGTISEVHFIR